MAYLPVIYALGGGALLVGSAEHSGAAAPGLAVAGGLCFVASAIVHRRR